MFIYPVITILSLFFGLCRIRESLLPHFSFIQIKCIQIIPNTEFKDLQSHFVCATPVSSAHMHLLQNSSMHLLFFYLSPLLFGLYLLCKNKKFLFFAIHILFIFLFQFSISSIFLFIKYFLKYISKYYQLFWSDWQILLFTSILTQALLLKSLEVKIWSLIIIFHCIWIMFSKKNFFVKYLAFIILSFPVHLDHLIAHPILYFLMQLIFPIVLIFILTMSLLSLYPCAHLLSFYELIWKFIFKISNWLSTIFLPYKLNWINASNYQSFIIIYAYLFLIFLIFYKSKQKP